jgi:hypothetical protein
MEKLIFIPLFPILALIVLDRNTVEGIDLFFVSLFASIIFYGIAKCLEKWLH